MGTLDETDMQILQLLVEDSQQTYGEIGEQVNLSPPAVSNRISRLRDRGIVRRFTVDVDRSMLTEANATLLEIQVRPSDIDSVVDALRSLDNVEYLVQTRDARVTALVHLSGTELREYVSDALEDHTLLSYEVQDVVEVDWNPQLGTSGFEVTCAECKKSIHGEEITIEADDRTYHLCCASCESLFRDRYERLSQANDTS